MGAGRKRVRKGEAGAGLPPAIAVDRGSAVPLYRQIHDGFCAAIVRGDLRAGQRVPSSRALAADFGISRLPVLNAYAQLLAEGFLETRSGSETYVCQRLVEGGARRREAAPEEHGGGGGNRGQPARLPGASGRSGANGTGERRVAHRAAWAPELEVMPWAQGWGSFGVHQPALDAFPFRIWSQLAARHSRSPRLHAMQPLALMGSLRFREAICAYLRTSRAVRCDPDQIMVVSGSQQALDIAARVLTDPGDAVWMEEPGYWLARDLFRAHGCRIVPVPVDAEGLRVEAGVEPGREARLVYVTPSHQFPLGMTMSASRRMQLLAWARHTGAWILEDDYDSEYRYDSMPIASLQGLDKGLDASGRVIYIGTFSKVLFPALRAGYMVIPRDLVPRFLAIRHRMDICPPYLTQEILCDFMHEGHFVRHLRRTRPLYRERRECLAAQLREVCGGRLEILGSRAGMHLTAVLDAGAKSGDGEIARRAAGRRLWLWPLSSAYAGAPRRQGFVLGFGSTPPAAIPAAVRRLRALLG